MSATIPNCISVTTEPTFKEFYIASFTILRYRRPVAILFASFPLAALFLLATPLMGYRLGAVEITLAVLGIAYPFYLMAFTVWLCRRRNKLARGPRTYSFDSEGMCIKGETFSQTLLWAAILRIRRTRRFLLIFISPSQAYFIPLKAISNPEFLDELRTIAGARTDFAG